MPMATTWRARRVIVFGLLAAGVGCIAVAALRLWPLFAYGQQRRAGEQAVVQLLSRRSPDVDAAVWEVATTWATIAYANVCFSAGYVSLPELRRFSADVEQRIGGDVDLATVDWIWQRLGETGPHGQQYRQRFEPQYRANLKAALANQSTGP
jgi:hypothetical protein